MPADVLALYQTYSRRDIHAVFEPETPFTTKSGTWGLQGIIRLARRSGDFVFIVSFGRSQGAHAFDEGVSAAGILRWQSQPKQSIADTVIRVLINHNEDKNTIHLFLRTSSRANGTPPDYTYLGLLKYESHDSERERPVHFAWQLLSWPIPETVIKQMGLTLEQEPDTPGGFENALSVNMSYRPLPILVRISPPVQQTSRGENTLTFKAHKQRLRREMENRELGLAGEKLVVEFEQQSLTAAGRPELALKVKHTALIEGDGAGFDVASFFCDGRPKYVEVKTTRGPKESDFFISANEVAFANSRAENYELYRLFEFEPFSSRSQFFVISGREFQRLALTATQFRVGSLAAK